MRKTIYIFILLFVSSVCLRAQNIPTRLELKQYEPTEKFMISGSHGDAEIVLGWWGWYGMTENVAKTLSECADKAIAEPSKYKYTFEYDAASWSFYDKFYPEVIQKIRKAVQLGSWEVTGGTYSIHLPYMVGIESNVRQWTKGQSCLHEILGTSANVFHFQEFLLFPQLPMYLSNTGIHNSFYENHMAICGSLDKDWRGVKIWESANGCKVKAVSEYPQLRVGWPDLLHIRPTTKLMYEFFESLPEPEESFQASEKDFHFDAAEFSDSYGNMVSVNCAKTEYELLTAERLAILNRILGGKSYAEDLDAAWRGLLTFQSHGIIYCGSTCYCAETGSSLWEAGKYHLDLARQIAERISTEALTELSERMLKPQPGSSPLVAFNPMAHQVSPELEQRVSLEKGFARHLQLSDGESLVPVSVSDMERYEDGSIRTATLSFKPTLPAMGIKAFYLQDSPEAEAPSEKNLMVKGEIMENEHIRMDFNKNGILAIYSKDQGRLIFGRDVSMESMDRYDKTYAICLRSSFKVNDRIQPKGYEVVCNDDLKAVVKFKYETENANHDLLVTLFRDTDYFDLTVRHRSKKEDGTLMKMPLDEYKERFWLDFVPAFKGDVKCNTVGDVQYDQREFYYSSSWLNVDSPDAGYSIYHKGIHSYDLGYVTQVSRCKRYYALSAYLASTTNEWVGGMVVFNSQFGEDGVVSQEFRVDLDHTTDEYQLEKSARTFLYNYPIVSDLHLRKGNKSIERSFLEIRDGREAFVSAFYEDCTTGGQPMIRFYNPKNEVASIGFNQTLGNISLQKARFDAKVIGEEKSSVDSLELSPRTLDSYLVSGFEYTQPVKSKGLEFSNVPYEKRGKEYLFDAPMESCRFIKQYAKYNDGKGNVYFIKDLYDDIHFDFDEQKKDGIFRVFEGHIALDRSQIGEKMRLVTLWNVSHVYGIGTCILTDDYRNRADEPVTLYVNGKKVDNYNFDITDYVKAGDNRLVLKVLAEEPSNEKLMKRSSVKQYLAFDIRDFKQKDTIVNAGFFEDIKESFVRIGARYDESRLTEKSYCRIFNPDFSTRSLAGWKKSGAVELCDNVTNYFAAIGEGSSITKQVYLKAGDYFLNFNGKSKDAEMRISIVADENNMEDCLKISEDRWQKNEVFFKVPKDTPVIFTFRSDKGKFDMDNFIIIKN